MMQPIHLAIGIVEGFATAAVVSFVCKARPEILRGAAEPRPAPGRSLRNVLLAFLAAAVLTGGVVSWFASGDPDGLEWSIAKVTGKEEFKGPDHGVHGVLAALQEKIAFLPDYSFRKPAEAKHGETQPPGDPRREGEAKREEGGKPGTSVSGIVGGTITLALVFLAGFLLKRRSRAA
jgi:cobalt/nickel transport system permease protein